MSFCIINTCTRAEMINRLINQYCKFSDYRVISRDILLKHVTANNAEVTGSLFDHQVGRVSCIKLAQLLPKLVTQ